MPVVCPPLIPTGGVVPDPGLYGFEGPPLSDRAGDFYLLTFNNGDNPPWCSRQACPAGEAGKTKPGVHIFGSGPGTCSGNVQSLFGTRQGLGPSEDR
jgi:hypothetical protein